MGGKYALGMDFGTESVRFLLVNTRDCKETFSVVIEYPHGVIERKLLDSGRPLPTGWALQHPSDWIHGIKKGVPLLLTKAGAKRKDIIGIGIDFTSCTMLPVGEDGSPLCLRKVVAGEPHAWPKLWKHHAAQPQADRFNKLAKEMGIDWIDDYGGQISSEWMIPKALQILQEAPNIYRRADCFMEAGDWVVRFLTGSFTRNACAAGYKALWAKERGFPDAKILAKLRPEFATLVEDKLGGEIIPPGSWAGVVQLKSADETGLAMGTPVAAAIIDAHAGVPGAGVALPGKLVMVLGTSTCHMLLGKKKVAVKGIAGAVTDGILAGYCGYEAGQAATGDIISWLVRKFIGELFPLPRKRRIENLFESLEEEASKIRPGAGGVVSLDWWNGNRSVLMDADLSGMIAGLSLGTTAAHLYRSIIEATAFGTRRILTAFEDAGVPIDEIHICGGLAKKNRLLRQIYADICGRDLKVVGSDHTSALGAAMLGAVAAGNKGGGFDSIQEATEVLTPPIAEVVKPDPHSKKVYNDLYQIYLELHDNFGIKEKSLMHRLKNYRR